MSINGIFDEIYKRHKWGMLGSGSGPGSDLRYAQGTTRILKQVVAMLSIHSFLDAPCGAREWQTPLVHKLQSQDPNFRYLGIDVSQIALSKNQDPRLPTLQQDIA